MKWSFLYQTVSGSKRIEGSGRRRRWNHQNEHSRHEGKHVTLGLMLLMLLFFLLSNNRDLLHETQESVPYTCSSCFSYVCLHHHHILVKKNSLGSKRMGMEMKEVDEEGICDSVTKRECFDREAKSTKFKCNNLPIRVFLSGWCDKKEIKKPKPVREGKAKKKRERIKGQMWPKSKKRFRKFSWREKKTSLRKKEETRSAGRKF